MCSAGNFRCSFIWRNIARRTCPTPVSLGLTVGNCKLPRGARSLPSALEPTPRDSTRGAEAVAKIDVLYRRRKLVSRSPMKNRIFLLLLAVQACLHPHFLVARADPDPNDTTEHSTRNPTGLVSVVVV